MLERTDPASAQGRKTTPRSSLLAGLRSRSIAAGAVLALPVLVGSPSTADAQASSIVMPAAQSNESAAAKAARSSCERRTGLPTACKNTRIFGHRCRQWADDNVTNENTLYALRWVARAAPGTGCEIDVWRLADGATAVHHDNTWNRTIDPATRGSSPDSVTSTTSAQVARFRTNGGKPVATLKQMMTVAGRRHVPLMIETKNFTPSAYWHRYALRVGANVRWYQQAWKRNDCRLGMLETVKAAGARVGVKDGGDCDSSPTATARRGTFFITSVKTLTRAQVSAYRQAGVNVGPFNASQSQWSALVRKGARIVIAPNPRTASRWFGRL